MEKAFILNVSLFQTVHFNFWKLNWSLKSKSFCISLVWQFQQCIFTVQVQGWQRNFFPKSEAQLRIKGRKPFPLILLNRKKCREIAVRTAKSISVLGRIWILLYNGNVISEEKLINFTIKVTWQSKFLSKFLFSKLDGNGLFIKLFFKQLSFTQQTCNQLKRSLKESKGVLRSCNCCTIRFDTLHNHFFLFLGNLSFFYRMWFKEWFS